jgi:DNA-binding CsgD family transcriptional regulator
MAGQVSDAGAIRFKRVAHTCQAEIEELLRMASLLHPADRALVQAIYGRGVSPGEFAQAIGCSRRSVLHRLKRIALRIRSSLFRFVVCQEMDWTFDRRTIAQSVILRGQTQRATARQLGVSVHYVRTELAAIKLLFQHQQQIGRNHHDADHPRRTMISACK